MVIKAKQIKSLIGRKRHIYYYVHFNNPQIRQIAVALNICVFQQLFFFFIKSSHQLLATHEDGSKATKKSDTDLHFISVTKSWHPTQFLSLQGLKFKLKRKKERETKYKSVCLSNPS